jgi:hypothetical protein
VNQRGRVWLSNASIRGAVGLRAGITNHRATDDDVRAVVEEVLVAAEESTPSSAAQAERIGREDGA